MNILKIVNFDSPEHKTESFEGYLVPLFLAYGGPHGVTRLCLGEPTSPRRSFSRGFSGGAGFPRALTASSKP